MFLFTMRVGDHDIVLGQANGNNPVSAFEMLTVLLARRQDLKIVREDVSYYTLADGKGFGRLTEYQP